MSFKYHVVEETYRDSKRLMPGEVWITEDEIHNSRALYPADEATEDAYLKAFPEPRKSQMEHPSGHTHPLTGHPTMVPNPKFGRHTGSIIADRKARKEAAASAAKEGPILPAPKPGSRASDSL